MTLAWLALAFWPVWPYLARRAADGSDDPWGLLAAATLFPWLARRSPSSRVGWREGTGLCLYALLAGSLPELGGAALAMLVLGMALSRIWFGRLQPGVLGLCLLSLPSLASLQFYLGYPLRLVVASAAACLVGASRDGLVVGHQVAVDAPCSGLAMLWALGYLASLLALSRNLDGRIFLVAGLAALAGNIWRASSLYYATRLGLGHEAIGLVSFGLAAAAVTWAGLRMKGRPQPEPGAAGCPSWLPLVCLLAAAVPGRTASPADTSGFPGWPGSLVPLPLTAEEEVWQRGFPGRIGRFQAGDQTLVLRWVKEPTRMLHSAADCYRGLGYAVGPATWQDDRACFEVSRGLERLWVEEWVEDGRGRRYADVSSWYWAAICGQSCGPWWAWVATRKL